MALKQNILLIMVLLISAEIVPTGFALRCSQCSGDVGDCTSKTAHIANCVKGQDRCAKVMINKDGKESVLYGCASKKHCMTGDKDLCKEVEKVNLRAKCMFECCNTTVCNSPPERKDTRLMCFSCISAKSMDDCVQKSKPGHCAFNETRCGKFTTELKMGGKKVMVYRKGCQTDKTCEKENDLYGQACGSDDTCDFKCCDKDLCNAGSLASVGVVSLFTCAFLSVVYI